MGNDIQEDNFEKIDPNEIIENDCYEEIDLQKINRIIEKEKNWNKNSIVISLNEFDLKKLNEDNKVLEYKNENEKNNPEVLSKVIEDQKNECGSQDEKNKEVKEDVQNNNNKDDNNDKKENEEEKKEEEKKEEEKKEIKEANKIEIIENENNKNEINNNSQAIINISNQQDEIKKEDEAKDNKNTNNEIKNIKSFHNQVKEKINKKMNKLKNKKPRIRPKNTSDEALKGAGNNSNLQKKGKEVKKNNDKSPNKKDVKTENNENNNNHDSKKDEKKESVAPVEKKDPSEEFDIKNIIPEYRLNHLKDDEIIYSGTLEKILKIPDKNTIAYSQRFCIFTKNYFAYYKSKESYISLNKPMLLINNNFIIRIENTILDGGSYYFGIICEVNDETRNLINKVNSFVTNEANTCELLLGFRTKEYENMMKWVVVLRYFISNQNDDF